MSCELNHNSWLKFAIPLILNAALRYEHVKKRIIQIGHSEPKLFNFEQQSDFSGGSLFCVYCIPEGGREER